MVNNGGFNSYLTASSDRDAHEVLASLQALGASKCAARLSFILARMGVELPSMSQEERWEILDVHWKDDLDDFDSLDSELDAELMSVLEVHVDKNLPHYLARV